MALKKPIRAALRTQVVQHQTSDPASVSRMMDQLSDAAEANAKTDNRARRTVSLVVGSNRIAHGLGRRAFGATVVPTVADATFAWSFAADGDKYVLITVVGVGQPDAPIEFF